MLAYSHFFNFVSSASLIKPWVLYSKLSPWKLVDRMKLKGLLLQQRQPKALELGCLIHWMREYVWSSNTNGKSSGLAFTFHAGHKFTANFCIQTTFWLRPHGSSSASELHLGRVGTPKTCKLSIGSLKPHRMYSTVGIQHPQLSTIRVGGFRAKHRVRHHCGLWSRKVARNSLDVKIWCIVTMVKCEFNLKWISAESEFLDWQKPIGTARFDKTRLLAVLSRSSWPKCDGLEALGELDFTKSTISEERHWICSRMFKSFSVLSLNTAS